MAAAAPRSLYNKDYNNFAPRIALAYDLSGDGKTVIRAGWGMFYDAFSQDIFLAHIPYNCTFCPGPAYTGVGVAADRLRRPERQSHHDRRRRSTTRHRRLGSYFGVDPNIRTPYVQNWNLNIQRQISNKIMAQIGYVGSKGTKLFRFRDINQPTQAQITAFDLSQCATWGQTAPNCFIAGFDGPDGVNFNVPRTTFPNFFYVNQEESTANSIYNALQASLHMNAWHGLSLQANYVWSHSIDDASDLEDFIPNAAQPNNSLEHQGGARQFQLRHPQPIQLELHLPGSEVRRRVRQAEEWMGHRRRPQPAGRPALQLQLQLPGRLLRLGRRLRPPRCGRSGSLRQRAGQLPRPDVVRGALARSATPRPTRHRAIATVFQAPATSAAWDATHCAARRSRSSTSRCSKTRSSPSACNLQLRAEFFNLFNHPNFANPVLPNFIADPGVNGIDSVGRGVGSYALTATGDVGIGNPFLGGGGPRGLQVAAKITF